MGWRRSGWATGVITLAVVGSAMIACESDESGASSGGASSGSDIGKPPDSLGKPGDAGSKTDSGEDAQAPLCGGRGQACCASTGCKADLACVQSVCVNAVNPYTCAPGSPPAVFVSEVQPATSMVPYQRFTAQFVIGNCSGSTWTKAASATAGSGYKLGFETPREYDPFGQSRVALPANVPNASSVIVTLPLRAPPLSGGYYYGWTVLNEGVAWLQSSTPRGVTVRAIPKVATICPGVQADIGGGAPASAEIQRCVDATAAGGVLDLPAGTYRINSAITINRPITLRTAGTAGSPHSCWSYDSPPCAVLMADAGLNVPRGFIRLEDTSNVTVDHIVIDGNRQERLGSSAAAQCASGTNGPGFNAGTSNCAGCAFTNGVSARALCGTGWEWVGDNATFTNNMFRNNGDKNTRLMWADGLTLLDGDSSKVTNNRFVDNSDIDFISGGAVNALFKDNTVMHVLQGAFAGIMLDNFNGGTTGNFSGAMVTGNAVNCGSLLCDFGFELGPHAWYLSQNIMGGTVSGNGVVGAKININAEGAGTAGNPITVTGNLIGGTPGNATYGCGQTRSATAFNVSPDSHVVTAGGAGPSASFQYHICP